VNLRDTDLPSDLGLAHASEVAKMEKPPLPLVENAEPLGQNRPVLPCLVAALGRPVPLEQSSIPVAVYASGQRDGLVRDGDEGFGNLLLPDSGFPGQLRDRRGPFELGLQLGGACSERDVQLLEPARNPDRRCSISEMPLDLADDVRNCVGRQIDAAVELEPVDRVDQSDRADLYKIVVLLTPACKAPGKLADKREVLVDQLLAGPEVSMSVVLVQQLA